MQAGAATDSLKQILAQRGTGILSQPELLHALLLDHCPEHKADIHLLISSLQIQFPQRLLAASDPVVRSAVIGQGREQMHEELSMRPEKAQWTIDAWLAALPLSGMKPPEPLPPVPASVPPRPTPVPMTPEEIRAFIRSRARHWVFRASWYKKVEDELVARGVAREDATRYLDEYSGGRQSRGTPAKGEPFPWKSAAGRMAYLLVAIGCLVLFLVVLRMNPLSVLAHSPAAMMDIYHFVSQGNWSDALSEAGSLLGVLVGVLVMIGCANKALR